MKFVKRWWPHLLLVAVATLFFYKTVFRGLIPFPGDLLLSEYNPWRHASYGGYNPGTVPSKVQYFDVLRELYPWKRLAIEEIKQGRLPLWNPYNFSGTPLLANYQSAVLYPLNVLYFLLPFDIAWSVLVMLQPLLGSLFFYLFATTIGISPWGAILGAIAFNYGSFANVWMEFGTVWQTILWLPLILWCVEKRKTILLALAVYSSATAGHPQDFLYVLGVSIVYTIARIFIRPPLAWQGEALSKTVAVSLVIGLLGGLGLAAAQLFPTIELFRASARVPHDYQFIIHTMLIPPWQLIKMFIPDFFGNPATKTYFLNDTYVNATLSVGLVGSTLAIASLFSPSASWHRKFFIWTSTAVLILTVRSPITEILYRFPIPILSTGSPTRMLSILALSLAVLAGLGWDSVSGHLKKVLRALAIVAVILASAWVAAYVLRAPTSVRATILATLVFIGTVASFFLAPKAIRGLLISTILTLELLFAFLKFNPFVPRSFVFPPHPLWEFLASQNQIKRFWGYGTAHILPNISTLYRIQSPDGIDPLNLKTYNQFIQGSHNGTLARTFSRTTRSDAFIAPGFGEQDLPNNMVRLRVLDALGVRYVIDRVENAGTAITFPPQRFTPLWKQDGWTVFENTKAAARFFLTQDIRTYQSTEEFETQFFSPEFNPGQTVLVEASSQLPSLTIDAARDVRLISYTPTRVVFETSTQTPQLLFLSDADDGNWRAIIDGKESPILRANWAFRAVLVPAGTHEVKFFYLPRSFITGIVVTGVTLALLAYAFFF